MEQLDFSEEEIQEQLAALGYTNITKQRLQDFKRDLDLLVHHEKSKSSSSAEWSSPKSHCSSRKSPPAFTKEKVFVPSAGSKHSCIYHDSRAAVLHQKVLTSAFNDESPSGHANLGKFDSYINHSIAPKSTRPSTAPNRLEEEAASSDSSQTSQIGKRNGYEDTYAKPAIKRKVLRKHRGQIHICDESTHSEDSEPVSELEEHLEQMRVSASYGRQELDLETVTSGYSDRHSSKSEDLSSAFQAYIKGMRRSHSESDIRPHPKSFIRPIMDHPHTRNLKKSDPVAKYFQYKQAWEMFKAPGEKSRKDVHWALREQLMYQPPPPKPQRVYVPNTYVVPTEKKRSSLRWEIRHDLANCIVPTKITYP